MRKIALLFFSVLSMLSIHGQDPIETVPIDFVKNLIFVKVYVNQAQEPLNFLFDTGAGVTVLDEKIAKRINVVPSDSAPIGTSGKTLSVGMSRKNSLTIGSTNIPNLDFALMDLSHLSQYLKTDLAGIIGIDLLDRFVVRTHIDSKTLHLYPFDNFQYRGKAHPQEMIGLESGHIGIPIEISPLNNGEMKPVVVKIDTGADNYLTFHNGAVKRLKLLDSGKKLKIKKGFGADASITTNYSGKIPSAKLNKRKWQNVPAVFEVDALNQTSKREADGLIGQALLLDFNIVYNLKNRLVYLEERK